MKIFIIIGLTLFLISIPRLTDKYNSYMKNYYSAVAEAKLKYFDIPESQRSGGIDTEFEQIKLAVENVQTAAQYGQVDQTLLDDIYSEMDLITKKFNDERSNEILHAFREYDAFWDNVSSVIAKRNKQGLKFP